MRSEEQSRRLIKQALGAKNATILVCRRGSRVIGAASFRVVKNSVKLISIGSLEKGCGKRMAHYIRNKHPGMVIWGKARAAASGFYEALGAKRGLAIAAGKELAYLYSI